MVRKKKPNPLNLFQRSQTFRNTFEEWKQTNLNPQEPNHTEPSNEPYESNHPENQRLIQDSMEPMSEPPDDSELITFPPVVTEIMDALSRQTDFTAGLEGRIRTLENENQELRSRLVGIEDTEVIQEAFAWKRIHANLAREYAEENEDDEDDEDDDETDEEEELDEEEIRAVIEQVVATYYEKYAEMLEKHLSRYFKHLNDSLAQLDEKSKELDRLLPVFKQNVEAHIKRGEQRKDFVEVYRNMTSFIRREFAPLHRQMEQIRRDRLVENGVVQSQNAG